jgi:hypothetical protein
VSSNEWGDIAHIGHPVANGQKTTLLIAAQRRLSFHSAT